jgi:hypothetical protein
MTIKPSTSSSLEVGLLPGLPLLPRVARVSRSSRLFGWGAPRQPGVRSKGRSVTGKLIAIPLDPATLTTAAGSAVPSQAPTATHRRGRLAIPTLAVVFAGSLLSACGTATEPSAQPGTTDTTQATAPTPSATAIETGKTKLTSAQALKFSRMLYLNTEATGGEVSASFEYGPAATFYFNGNIDWVKATGDMILSTKLNGKETVNPERIRWSKGILYREIPGLEEAMGAQGQLGIRYVARPIQKDQAPLDLAITYLAALAIAQPMNPLLVRQDPEHYWFAGANEIDGVTVESFGNGRSTYSVGPDGHLKRIDTTFKAMAGPVQVNFGSLGAQQIELPAADATVDIAEIPVLYAQLTTPTTAPTSAARVTLPSRSEVPATEA